MGLLLLYNSSYTVGSDRFNAMLEGLSQAGGTEEWINAWAVIRHATFCVRLFSVIILRLEFLTIHNLSPPELKYFFLHRKK